MYRGNHHPSNHRQPAPRDQSPSDGTDLVQASYDGLKALAMTMLCMDPGNSSSDDSPNATPHKNEDDNSSKNQQALKPPLPKSFQAFIQKETAARAQIAKTYHDELTQMDALFCATSEKKAMEQEALTLATQLFFSHFPKQQTQVAEEKVDGRNSIDETSNNNLAAETSEYDAADETSDNDFVEVPNPSEPRFFQSTPPAEAPKKGWIDWALRR